MNRTDRSGGPLVAIAAALPVASVAQETDWTFTLTPYVWIPGVTTAFGTERGSFTADRSGGDALSDLDFAFMGTFEARRGKWGMVVDLIYADLSAKEDTPFGVLFDGATVETRVATLSGYVAYRVYEDAAVAADLLGGVRGYSVELDLSLDAGRLPGEGTRLSEDWLNPLIGGRVGFRFNDRWTVVVAADVGGFEGGADSTWQALATVGYHLDDHWAVRAG